MTNCTYSSFEKKLAWRKELCFPVALAIRKSNYWVNSAERKQARSLFFIQWLFPVVELRSLPSSSRRDDKQLSVAVFFLLHGFFPAVQQLTMPSGACFSCERFCERVPNYTPTSGVDNNDISSAREWTTLTSGHRHRKQTHWASWPVYLQSVFLSIFKHVRTTALFRSLELAQPANTALN